MDINALASSLTTALVPLLPYLFKAGEKAAEETGKTVASFCHLLHRTGEKR